MHYYPFHIGDYRAATAHLSNEEDLAYRRLLDYYYDTELPIPNPNPALCKRLRLGLEVIESVLNDMFIQTEEGWVHPRCQEEIMVYNQKIETARANGKRGGRGKKTQPFANANPTLTQPLTNQDPITNNQDPITNKFIDQSSSSKDLTPPKKKTNASSKGGGCFFKINNRGEEMSEEEWLFRCFLEKKRARREATEGCETLTDLVSIYPTYMGLQRRWLTKPIALRMSAYALMAKDSKANDPFTYALDIAERPEKYTKLPAFLRISEQAVEEQDYEVKI